MLTIYEILTVLHVLGAAIGVGAAATSDSIFLTSIRNRRISRDQFVLISKSSDVVLGGLALLVITGIALFLYDKALWQLPHFQAKMTAVIVLMINGIVFHTKVIPLLEKCKHEKISEHVISSNHWLLSITGCVSVVSWFSAIIIAVIGPVEVYYVVYMGIYLALIVIGSVTAYFVFSHLIFREKDYSGEERKYKSKNKTFTVVSIATLLFLLVATLAYGVFSQEEEEVQEVDLELGANIYQSECASRHGPDGALVAGEFSLLELSMTKEEGMRNMPAFEDELTDDEITAANTYAKKLQDKNND